jgi:diketogulonate reductase-like aldo/keto reductase
MDMPPIIYGTAWKKERTEALVTQALREGYRGIDTACQPKHYHEPGVGAAIVAALRAGLFTRDQLYVQTKFTSLSGQDPKRVPYDPNAPLRDQIAQSFAASLRNLQVDYLDAWVLHSPMPRNDQTLEAWQAMEAFVDSGDVKRLGISNCYSLKTLETLHRSSRVKPSILQNRFYAESDYDIDLRAFCMREGITYQSFWTLTANPHLLEDETVRLLTLKYQRTPPQILFRYLTQLGVTPLTGTTSVQHMREDLSIFDFELTETEIKAITALL